MKCVECITALFLFIEYYTYFVRNDEIKMSNQSIKKKIFPILWSSLQTNLFRIDLRKIAPIYRGQVFHLIDIKRDLTGHNT